MLENIIMYEEIVRGKPKFIFITGKAASGKTTISNKLEKENYTIIHVDDIIHQHFQTWPKLNVISENLTADQQKVADLLITEIDKYIRNNIILEGIIIRSILELVFQKYPPDLMIYVQHKSIESHVIALTQRASRDIETKFKHNSLGNFWNKLGAKEAIEDYKIYGICGSIFGQYIQKEAEYHSGNLVERRNDLFKDWKYYILYVNLKN